MAAEGETRNPWKEQLTSGKRDGWGQDRNPRKGLNRTVWEKGPMTWIIEPPPYLHISPLRQLLTHVVDNIL